MVLEEGRIAWDWRKGGFHGTGGGEDNMGMEIEGRITKDLMRPEGDYKIGL